MSEIKIFVTHTPNKDDYVIKNNLLMDVIAGAEYQTKPVSEDLIGDNTGDNISIKNKMYCELTTQYWAWKNIKADYYGFCHYRRFMYLNDKKLDGHDARGHISSKILNDYTAEKFCLNDENAMKAFIEQYDCIIPKKQDFRKLPTPRGKKKSVYEHFAAHHRLFMNRKDLDILLDIVNELFPEYSEHAKKYVKSPYFWGFNCFILKKEYFYKLCEFEFSVLEELEKRVDLQYYNQQMTRIYGFMGEILSCIFLDYLICNNPSLRVAEVDLVYFEDTKKVEKIKPISSDIMPVVFYVDESSPFLITATLRSFLSKTEHGKTYDIIIAHNRISEKYLQAYKEILSENDNILLRYLDIRHISDTLHEFCDKWIDTRLFLPWILPDYSKLVCINWNVLFEEGIDEILNVNIDDSYVAGSRDIVRIGRIKDVVETYEEYIRNTLKVEDIYDWINSEVFFMNLEEIRKGFVPDHMIEIINSLEQPVDFSELLNMVFQKKRKVLDANRTVYYTEDFAENKLISQAPLFIFNEYNKAKERPLLITFTPGQLKDFEGLEFNHKFWDLISNTIYYHKFISYFSDSKRPAIDDRTPLLQRKIKGWFQCVKDHGLVYTIGYTVKKIIRIAV